MTNTEAIANRDAARHAYNTATTNRARREAAEDLDFWIGKVAALTTGYPAALAKRSPYC